MWDRILVSEHPVVDGRRVPSPCQQLAAAHSGSLAISDRPLELRQIRNYNAGAVVKELIGMRADTDADDEAKATLVASLDAGQRHLPLPRLGQERR